MCTIGLASGKCLLQPYDRRGLNSHRWSPWHTPTVLGGGGGAGGGGGMRGSMGHRSMNDFIFLEKALPRLHIGAQPERRRGKM